MLESILNYVLVVLVLPLIKNIIENIKNFKIPFSQCKKCCSLNKVVDLKESPTGYRMSVLNEARKRFSFKNIWTYDRRILYKDNTDGQKIKIYYE